MMKKNFWSRLFLGVVVVGVVSFSAIMASECTSELTGALAAEVEHVLSEEILVQPLKGTQQDVDISASAKEAQVVDFIKVTPEPQQVAYVETTPVPTKEPEKITADETVEVVQKKEPSYDSYEINQLYRIVHAESAGEPFEGQMAVAAVILNRKETKGFPNDICKIIWEKEQFAPAKNGEIYFLGKVLKQKDVSQSVIEATRRALEGEDPTEKLLWAEAERLGLDPEKYAAGGALFFYSPKGCTQEALKERETIKVKVQIEGHIFYKYWDR